MNLQETRGKLEKKLTDVSELTLGVLRGVRINNDREVASYVFDLNNWLPDTVGALSSYLDEVMGPNYFAKDASPDLRWNNYLYFVVDRETAKKNTFQTVKRKVEADRSYARKYVIIDEDLDRVLDELDSVAVINKSSVTIDVVETWSEALSAVGLDDVLDGERPISDVVRNISSATGTQSVRVRKSTGIESSEQLIGSHIASIDLGGFRPFPQRQSVKKLGKANLIFGPNGVGKTSLLEGIEFLYCGGNRRSNPSSGASVEAVLASGRSVSTSERQPLSDFKTRQRLWYGSDDNSRQNKLRNQFARFNFLNTDAAAELSLFKDSPANDNAESIASLLSGHEATLMWRRIQEVRKAVGDESRAKRSERAVALRDKATLENELAELEAAPGKVDAVFSVFIKDLERVGWRDIPHSKDLVTDHIIGTIARLTSNLSVIRQLGWLDQPITEGVISQHASVLRRAIDDAKAELPQFIQDVMARQELEERFDEVRSRLTALQAISPNAAADMEKMSSDLQWAQRELSDHAKILAALPSSTPPDDWQHLFGSKFLLDVHSEVDNDLKEVEAELYLLREHLDTVTRDQSDLQRAMTELQSLAKNAVDHSHSDSNCPVCGTEFGPGQLIKRIQAMSLASSDKLTWPLQQRVEHLYVKKEELERIVCWIRDLVTFSYTLSEPEVKMTVKDVQFYGWRLAEYREKLVETKQRAQQGLEAYEQAGLSLDDIKSLCMPLDEDAYQEGTPIDVIAAVESARKYMLKLQKSILELDQQASQQKDKLERALEKAGVQPGDNLEAAVQKAMVRQRISQQALDACIEAHDYLQFEPDTDMDLLVTWLEASVLGGKKVQAALRSDEEYGTTLTTLRAQIANLLERIERIRTSMVRLGEAQNVLDFIIEHNSLDAASAAVIAATHEVADSIFGRIHAPAEYLVTADSSWPLRRRADGTPVQLNQISTGQRAAYALSMFMAMNAQVRVGPKVILLDDPISHIDDLNALSFLDYLRNLVLLSDRQVFFATADEKIAALFVHKFGFLGDDFRTIELARG